MSRSTSGADVHLFPDYVLKAGHGPVATRINEQADWLERHPSPAVPPVLTRSLSSFSMPRYQEIDWKELTPGEWERMVDLMVSTLAEHVWSQPAESEFDLHEHLRFMQRRCAELPGSFPKVKAWANWLDWDQPTCLTHGDPTFDNTVWNGTSVVFIDPNPARPAVPSTRAADLSNIAQSLLGYEHLKYGAPKPPIGPEILYQYLDDAQHEHLRYLTCTKFIRLLSYETVHKPVFAELAQELLDRCW